MKKRVVFRLVLLIVPLVAAVVFFFSLAPSGRVVAQQERSIRNTVVAAAVHCYAVEGFYPADIAYLQNNYGLIYDEKHYEVKYEMFASNVLPSVIVRRKVGGAR